jgi:hypothetical protein
MRLIRSHASAKEPMTPSAARADDDQLSLGELCSYASRAARRSGSAPTTYLNPIDFDSLTRRDLRETLRAIRVVQNRVDQCWVRRLER